MIGPVIHLDVKKKLKTVRSKSITPIENFAFPSAMFCHEIFNSKKI